MKNQRTGGKVCVKSLRTTSFDPVCWIDRLGAATIRIVSSLAFTWKAASESRSLTAQACFRLSNSLLAELLPVCDAAGLMITAEGV